MIFSWSHGECLPIFTLLWLSHNIYIYFFFSKNFSLQLQKLSVFCESLCSNNSVGFWLVWGIKVYMGIQKELFYLHINNSLSEGSEQSLTSLTGHTTQHTTHKLKIISIVWYCEQEFCKIAITNLWGLYAAVETNNKGLRKTCSWTWKQIRLRPSLLSSWRTNPSATENEQKCISNVFQCLHLYVNLSQKFLFSLRGSPHWALS